MIFGRFARQIESMIESRVDVVASGTCKTIEQYSHACGEILGLRRALEEFREMVKEDDIPADNLSARGNDEHGDNANYQ